MSTPYDTQDSPKPGDDAAEAVVATPDDDSATETAPPYRRRPRGELPADLTNTDLKGWDLSGASLRRADMRGAECTGADFTDAHMEEIRGEGAGFGMALLRGAELFSANLDDALPAVHLVSGTRDGAIEEDVEAVLRACVERHVVSEENLAEELRKSIDDAREFCQMLS